VLDVGCGTGTNAKHFEHTEYLGIDINQQYIDDARQRFKGQFIAADIRSYTPPVHARFDFVLINSFLHHLDSDNVKGVLGRVHKALTDDGHVHILEPVMPHDASISSLLAHLDRGRFVRSQRAWEMLFSELFEPILYESYPLTGAGVTLWNMLYFKGRARR
jgi:SAM-dependent methyltransferase